MISKYIDLRMFLISLAVGIFIVYIYQPTPTVIYVYPTPDNVNNIRYKDHAGNCFKFKANEVKCPEDTTQINTVPVQE